ncbi:hypothetical protein J1N10_03565 [Carboxylicivirga sp. A043]|nr:hypothetical protein [Carboxylicivirga sp. A043]
MEQQATEAPDDVWNNLSAQLDAEASEIHLNDDEHRMIDEVWRGLENELDIDEVWGAISDELDESKKKPLLPTIRYWLMAAIVLLIVGLTAVMHFFTEQVTQPSGISLRHTEESTRVNRSVVSDSLKIELKSREIREAGNDELIQSDSADIVKRQQNILLREESGAIKSALPDCNQESNTTIHSPMLASGSFFITNSNALLQGKQASIGIEHAFVLNPALVLPDNSTVNQGWIELLKPLAPQNSKEELVFDRKDSRWTTGVVTALKNTYLLNAETIDGFSPSGMNSSDVTFQPDIGLNVQYAINQKFIASVNVFLSSTSKQNSHVYNYGEYVHKETQLDYLAGELAIKHNAKHSLFGDKIIRRNVGGVYVAHLQSASETISQTTEDASMQYASLDYGVILGQEFELRNRGPVKISTGLTVKYGLPNVFKGDANVPGKFNKTQNASIEFRIGIAYRWGAKVGIDHYLGFIGSRRKMLSYQ